MAITHNGDWLADDFGDGVVAVWNASTYGYGVERWHDYMTCTYKYGLWRRCRPSDPRSAKERVGVFDSPEEVIAMLKLILASEEDDGHKR